MIISFLKTILNNFLKIILKHKNIFCIVFLFIIFNKYRDSISKKYFSFEIEFSNNFLYVKSINILNDIFSKNFLLFLFLFLFLFLIANFLTLISVKNLFQTYKKINKSFFSFWDKDLFKSYIFFTIYNIIYSIFFLILCTILFLLNYFFYRLNINTLYFFTFLILILFPVFYICISWSAFVSVFKLKNKDKIKKLFLLFKLKIFWNIYIFYSVRIILEIIITFLIFLLLKYLNLNILINIFISSFLLLIPFIFFRSSGFEIKLFILKDDEYIKNEFKEYFINLKR